MRGIVEDTALAFFALFVLFVIALCVLAEPVPRKRAAKPQAEKVPAPSLRLTQFPPAEVVRREIVRAEANRDIIAFLSSSGLIDRRHYSWAVETEARLRVWRKLLEAYEGGDIHFDRELGDASLGSYLSPEDYNAGRLPILP